MVQIYDPNVNIQKYQDLDLQRQRDYNAYRDNLIKQSDWLTENQQKQAQQAFENQDVVAQRALTQKAQDAADLGDMSAIKFLKAMSESANNTPIGSGTFKPDANGVMAPAKLRSGEIPIGQGQPQNDAMGGIGLSPVNPMMGQAGMGMTPDRLAASVLKQNPELANNPQAFFATLQKLQGIFPGTNTQLLDQMKKLQDLQNATPEGKKAIAAAEQAGKNSGDMSQVATGAKDVLNTYQQLKDSVTTPNSQLPSGALESGVAKAANYLNIPTEGSKAQGAFDAKLNNLFLATVRTLKGTGRVMQSEINNIQNAQPKASDSNAVKLAKLDAHMQYYRQRMKDLGIDPDTGKAASGASTEPSTGAAQGAMPSGDPLGLFGP